MYGRFHHCRETGRNVGNLLAAAERALWSSSASQPRGVTRGSIHARRAPISPTADVRGSNIRRGQPSPCRMLQRRVRVSAAPHTYVRNASKERASRGDHPTASCRPPGTVSRRHPRRNDETWRPERRKELGRPRHYVARASILRDPGAKRGQPCALATDAAFGAFVKDCVAFSLADERAKGNA